MIQYFCFVYFLWDGKINLKLKMVWGSSIRKVLVGEAKLFCASKIIVGVTKNNTVIG